MGSPEVVQVDPKKIGPPRDYIRQKGKQGIRPELEQEYFEAMKAYGGWGSFPPVKGIVHAHKGLKGREYTHENVDGVHRTLAAIRYGLTKIPMEIQPMQKDGDLYLAQYEMNRHGLKLDKRERDNAIRRLVEHYGFERKRVQEMSGLAKSSIDRVVKGQQLKEGPRKKLKKGAKAKAKKVAAQMPRDAKCSPPDFLNACKLLVRAFVGNREGILAEFRKVPKPWEVTLTGLGGIAQAFAKAGG